MTEPVRYRTIVADPPWEYEQFAPSHTPSQGRAWRIELPYRMMGVDEISALPVGEMADPEGARLFLWTTGRYLMASAQIVAAWGFTYKQPIVWRKTGQLNPLPATVAPNHAEFLLIAERGKVPRTGTWPSSVVEAPRLSHSEKPDVFQDIVEHVSPGPYLELFARRDRLGWDTWGNESLGTAEMAA
jgi:N6-adenosine-specific RNA methylase IME4